MLDELEASIDEIRSGMEQLTNRLETLREEVNQFQASHLVSWLLSPSITVGGS